MTPDTLAAADVTASLAKPATAPKVRDVEQARAAAKQFEAVFVTQMLSHMFAGIETENGPFGGGHAESMFRPMLLDEYGKMVANRGNGIGIADHVVRALLQNQEVQ